MLDAVRASLKSAAVGSMVEAGNERRERIVAGLREGRRTSGWPDSTIVVVDCRAFFSPVTRSDISAVILAMSPFVLTVIAIIRARRHRIDGADATLAYPEGAGKPIMAVCAVLMLGLVLFVISLHPPRTLSDHLSLLGITTATAAGVCVTYNKRLAVVGGRLVDISSLGRLRELPIVGPAIYRKTLFGWRLALGMLDVFVPGYWLMGDTDDARRAVDDFKELVMGRAERMIERQADR